MEPIGQPSKVVKNRSVVTVGLREFNVKLHVQCTCSVPKVEEEP